MILMILFLVNYINIRPIIMNENTLGPADEFQVFNRDNKAARGSVVLEGRCLSFERGCFNKR